MLPIVDSSWVHPFVAYLRAQNAPVEALLRQSRLPRGVTDRAGVPVAEPAVWEFVGRAAEAGAMPGLGFRVAHDSGLRSVAELTDHLAEVPSLPVAVGCFQSLAPESGYRLCRRGELAYFCRRGSGILSGAWQVEQYVVSLMIEAVQLTCGNDWRPRRVELQSSDAPGLEDGRLLEHAEIHLGQQETAIEVPLECLAMAARRGPVPSAGSVRQIAAVMRPYIGQDTLDSRFIAELFGISSRTLQRRLRELGTSYSVVAAEARFSAARDLLKDPSMRLIDVAYEIGFHDQGSFSRAFRAWSGLSPREYQATLPARNGGRD